MLHLPGVPVSGLCLWKVREGSMKKIIQSICALLEKDEPIVSATILSHAGSTPRTAGTKMIVCSDGKIIGTIGGGSVEAQIIQTALEVFGTGQVLVRAFDLSGSSNVNRVDVICGGKLEVLIEKIEPSPANTGIFQTLLAALDRGQRSLLVSTLPKEGDEKQRIERFLILDDNATHGEDSIPAIILDTIKEEAGWHRAPILLTIENKKYLAEPAVISGTVYLFGAGHVSQQVAMLTQMVDFRTVVLDDREAFANRERFKTADEILVLSDFIGAFSDLEIDEDSYVVIVTRGHRHDKTVLSQALRTKAGYIGMIGSRRKRDATYGALIKEGFTPEDLDRVHCPIGLEICAETPQEIAVSIVAELINARANKLERNP